MLHANGCAPRLYCTFQNGICYEFMQGDALGTQDVRDPSLLRLGHGGVMGPQRIVTDLSQRWLNSNYEQGSVVVLCSESFQVLFQVSFYIYYKLLDNAEMTPNRKETDEANKFELHANDIRRTINTASEQWRLFVQRFFSCQLLLL